MDILGNWEERRGGPLNAFGEIGRRTFVKLAGLSAAALVFGAGPFAQKAWVQTLGAPITTRASLALEDGDPRIQTAS